MKHHTLLRIITLIPVLSFLLVGRTAFAGEPVIHAVFFFSPSCPHCDKVINEDLTPLVEKYKEQLTILVVNTYSEEGNELYMAAVNKFDIPGERIGVPTLIVGNKVLVGSVEIPNELPEIIEAGLSDGGVDWPEIPGLHKLIENEVPEKTEKELNEAKDLETNPMDIGELDKSEDAVEGGETKLERLGLEQINSGVSEDRDFSNIAISAENMSVSERFMRDPEGNTLSIFVLFGLTASVMGSFLKIRGSNKKPKKYPNWVIPLILLVGLAVAFYMAYVEINQSEAVCGPVGDCNTVQQSKYASLFGIIPIGLFGVLGYFAIGFVWLFTFLGPTKLQNFCKVSLWVLALFGTLFSIYLTFLEPFVIGATCAWCLTSAIVMALLLWVSTPMLMEAKIGTNKKTKRGHR